MQADRLGQQRALIADRDLLTTILLRLGDNRSSKVRRLAVRQLHRQFGDRPDFIAALCAAMAPCTEGELFRLWAGLCIEGELRTPQHLKAVRTAVSTLADSRGAP